MTGAPNAAPQQAVVVTGVSTGIGQGLADALVAAGYKVFGSVRKASDRDKLSQRLGASFEPLIFDVTDEAAVQKAAELVRQALKGRRLAGLVNNAGVAWPAPFLHQPLADFRKILDANLLGTFIVTQAFLPLLGTDAALAGPPGRIINVTSVGGKYGAPFMAAYTASKHAVEGMSECLRRELLPYGIDVVIFGPGAVRTPIWEKAKGADVSAYKDTAYAGPLQRFVEHMVREGQESSHTPESVARSIVAALQSPRPWTRYAPVHKRLMNWTLPLLLPARLVDHAMAATFGLTPAAFRQAEAANQPPAP